MRVLGLINARGGSKGIPGKNIKPLLGKPLIAYAIDAGKLSKSVARVVVSTDETDIAEVARAYGADVPFLRPPHLATDTALQLDVVRHALLSLSAEGDEYDAVVILQPTCPLRTAEDVDGAISLMKSSGADTVISVTEVQGQHPLTMYSQAPDSSLAPLFPSDPAGVLRQTFPAVWWRNGAIYAIRTAVVLEQNSLYGKRVMGYPMPSERSSNIDNPIDWTITEALLLHAQKLGAKNAP